MATWREGLGRWATRWACQPALGVRHGDAVRDGGADVWRWIPRECFFLVSTDGTGWEQDGRHSHFSGVFSLSLESMFFLSFDDHDDDDDDDDALLHAH